MERNRKCWEAKWLPASWISSSISSFFISSVERGITCCLPSLFSLFFLDPSSLSSLLSWLIFFLRKVTISEGVANETSIGVLITVIVILDRFWNEKTLLHLENCVTKLGSKGCKNHSVLHYFLLTRTVKKLLVAWKVNRAKISSKPSIISWTSRTSRK